jgi:hypothetical protein
MCTSGLCVCSTEAAAEPALAGAYERARAYLQLMQRVAPRGLWEVRVCGDEPRTCTACQCQMSE